jgi:flagellar motor switch protein FliG
MASDEKAPLSLDGPEKAAVLLLALGKPLAGEVLKHLETEEIKAITRSASKLPQLPEGTLDRLVEEFALQFSRGLKFVGTTAEVEKLLEGVLTPEQISGLWSEEPQERPINVWTELGRRSDQQVADMIASEHPQIAAAILSRLPSQRVAGVLKGWEARPRTDVLRRLLGLGRVTPAAWAAIEDGLREALVSQDATAGGRMRSYVAEVLNQFDKALADATISDLIAIAPEDAAPLRAMLFSFEDLPKLEQRPLSLVMERIQSDQVVLALRGADAALTEHVLSCLAGRARRMVEAELQGGAEAPARDVQAARRAIAEQALRLAAEGLITLPGADQAA